MVALFGFVFDSVAASVTKLADNRQAAWNNSIAFTLASRVPRM